VSEPVSFQTFGVNVGRDRETHERVLRCSVHGGKLVDIRMSAELALELGKRLLGEKVEKDKAEGRRQKAEVSKELVEKPVVIWTDGVPKWIEALYEPYCEGVSYAVMARACNKRGHIISHNFSMYLTPEAKAYGQQQRRLMGGYAR
jgi:hypothetical protein